MAYVVVRPGELEWAERPSRGEGPPRGSSDLTTAAGLANSRARLWRLPPGSRGVRHAERVQEEVFLVLAGSLTMLLGDPPERVELEPHALVKVEPGTGLQLRNEGREETLVFVYGAPPVTGEVDYLDDVEP